MSLFIQLSILTVSSLLFLQNSVVVEGKLDLTPGIHNDTSYIYCIGPNCPNNNNSTSENDENAISDEPILDCGADDKVKPDADCRFYYACINGTEWRREQCPKDFAFSAYSGFCVRKEYVSCEFQCVEEGKFADYFNCQLFHVCMFGHRHDFLCSDGTVFSEEKGQCVPGSCE